MSRTRNKAKSNDVLSKEDEIARARLSGHGAADAKSIEVAEKLPPITLGRRKLSKACAPDGVRPLLGGAWLKVTKDGDLKLWATDSFLLYEADLPVPAGFVGQMVEGDVFVPVTTLKALEATGRHPFTLIVFDEVIYALRIDGTLWPCHRPSGQPPAYEKLIPERPKPGDEYGGGFGLNPALMSNLGACMAEAGVGMEFVAISPIKPILVFPLTNEPSRDRAIIMPIRVKS